MPQPKTRAFLGADKADLRGFGKIGLIACVLMLLVMPLQVAIYLIWPPPETVEGFFTLFTDRWLLGLLSLDLLYILSNTLLIPMYLALYAFLRQTSTAWMTLALAFGLIGVAAYYPSNPALEMLTLSSQYAGATVDAQKALYLASGETMLAIYRGTTFSVYYLLNALILLITSLVMFRSRVFSRATARMGLLAAILMTIPSTAGTIGKVFALLSLIPWAAFTFLSARRFHRAAYRE